MLVLVFVIDQAGEDILVDLFDLLVLCVDEDDRSGSECSEEEWDEVGEFHCEAFDIDYLVATNEWMSVLKSHMGEVSDLLSQKLFGC